MGLGSPTPEASPESKLYLFCSATVQRKRGSFPRGKEYYLKYLYTKNQQVSMKSLPEMKFGLKLNRTYLSTENFFIGVTSYSTVCKQFVSKWGCIKKYRVPLKQHICINLSNWNVCHKFRPVNRFISVLSFASRA